MKALDPRLLRYARATARLLAAAVLLGLLTAALAIAQAALLAHAIDATFLHGAGLGALRPWLAALLVVFASRAALAWGQEFLAHRVSATVKSRLRRQILERAVSLGPRWASEAHSGEVVALVTRGLDALDAYFARYLPQLALSAIIPPVVVVSLFLVDPLAGLTVALTVPLIPVFMALIGRATETRKRRRWNALSRLAHHFLDVVAGLPTLKVYGRAHAQLAGLRRVTDDYRRETLATLRVAFLSAFVLELAATLSVALVAVEVGLRLVAGEMDLTRGLFVLILAPEAYLPLRQLGANYHASEEGLAAAEAAFALVEARPEGHGPGLAPPDLRGGELRVEGLTVEHPDRAVAAPDGVSFTVRPGEVVALAGPSGAGKTTLLQTILGLRVPDRGRVVVAGADGKQASVDELDGEAWRQLVAWVPQQPFLFAGSVADNARLAAPGASDGAVDEALRAAGLGDLDPDRQLGERGLGLSSGQRRRLGVARALLRDAVLLLLDEPTAGLDAEAELAVLETVRDAARRRGMAVLLVAHRPAALAVADRVVAVASRAAA
ncbi:MAG: thiol reductant ABC exporter subunit CydD [Candidatus Limnocylindrales bacterium]